MRLVSHADVLGPRVRRREHYAGKIGDRAPFPAAGLAPSIVKLSTPTAGAAGHVVGSMKGDKDWKSENIPTEMTQATAGIWKLTPSKDLKPGDYAIVMRPANSRDQQAAQPEIVWPFTVK